MSLTSHLDNRNSPIRQFIYDTFPNTRPLLKDARQAVRQSETLRPSGAVIYGTVGTAIDYRFRYYFDVTPVQKLIAWQGARLANMADAQKEELVEGFFSNLEEFLNSSNVRHRILDPNEEEQLARYCYVLALFEQVYRAGPAIPSPLVERDYSSPQELLEIVTSNEIEDMSKLSYLFYERFHDTFDLPVTLNPTFAGSSDVGGADADFILGRSLIDIKATTKTSIEALSLYQLLGYVLLDYDDVYGITGIGLYMARQGLMFKWPLDEALNVLAQGAIAPLQDLRGRFKEVAQSLKITKTGE